MQISDLDYHLPQELIAQAPAERREDSRMLIVDRFAQTLTDGRFADIVTRLHSDDVLVLNNTKVFPARLIGRSETGASIEVFMVRQSDGAIWETLARPARRLHLGKRISFGPQLTGEVVDKQADGKVHVRFEYEGDFYQILDEIGKTPLPPYIKRDRSTVDSDRERYQTVFAKDRGAIAAPTAGLHFTHEIIEAVKAKGVTIAEITLHVGYGTFEPIRVDDLTHHTVSPESYFITDTTAELLNAAKTAGKRIVAVGTTTTRALESHLSSFEHFTPGSFSAGLTITPGYKFKAITALLTNFHLPQSSLLTLVSTFGGHELIMRAYRHSVAERYRFYSYGDCMLIV